ncbi:putative tail lysin [Bacillus phage BSP18]|nr:putative tail lysin [Bacillus phage BSP18]
MTTITRRYPQFEVDFITEKTSYELKYDTSKQLTQRDFEESILSFSTKNSMEDDSPVFSLVITAKEKWDKVLTSNDLIRIRVIPDVTKGKPENPYVMVGLISDIHKEGEYNEGTLLYRITGRAMTKALIDFSVGVIQEVATIIPSIGWLPDGEKNGLKFSGNTAAGIGDELMERFVYKYAKYDFAGGKKLNDYLMHSFSSWEDDEKLADATPFINYEGSIRQFLEDIVAKPFNELFFEYTSDGKCVALMRPTPFDPSKWYQLPTFRFTSDVVVQESFGKSDAEMYSVFVVQAPNMMEFSSMDLGVYPKFHPDLVKKYGYKRLDAQNRYLLSSTLNSSTQDASTGGSSGSLPSFEEVLTFITQNNFTDPEVLRTQKDTVYSELVAKFPSMSKSLANGIIDSLKAGEFTREEYNNLTTSTGDSEVDKEINKEKGVANKKLEKYTQRLFNWYCENVNFYNGDIRVIGNPTYRVGSRVLYEDFEQQTTWEFYVESVQHEFSFSNGYTTVLGVTRGLPNSGEKRFRNLWGKSEDFKGGYLGEKSLEDLLKEAQKANSIKDGEGDGSGGDWSDGSGGGGAMGALNTAKAMAERKSVYVFGGGRTGKNPFLSSPIKIDCSSFVWWCYYLNGVTLKGGKTGMTTDTIKVDPQLKTISSRGSSKSVAKSKIQQGDIVYFDTYKADGHVGIYLGAGKFIGAQSSTGIAAANMNSGYWWNKFNGRVLRYQG